MEQVSIIVTGYFFDLLLAQVNLQVAETNLENTQRIQQIANEKLELGKISKNEILQLKLEQLKAQKAAGTARRDMQSATLNRRAYTGLSSTDNIPLALPPATIDLQDATEKVLAEADANRSAALAFSR